MRPTINGRVTYRRIPIRRRTPVETLTYSPIRDDEDFERRVRVIRQWFRDFQGNKNIILTFGVDVVSDEEAALFEQEEAKLSGAVLTD